MKLLNQILLYLVIISAIISQGCGDKPILTELANNRLNIIIKGTYASNNPKPWDSVGAYDSVVQDDSVNDCSASGDVFPSVFMLDIAEIKLFSGEKHDFSNFRQPQVFNLSDDHPFFSGGGVILDCDDVPSSGYSFILIYVRKMLFDNAKTFNPFSGGWTCNDTWDNFAEMDLPAFNFNKFQTNSYYDTLRYEGALINNVFPLVIPIEGGLLFQKEFPLTVLEIRLVIKNFIKKYEYEAYDSNGVYSVMHYYAFSDWLQDVHEDETAIGGNILTVAWSYVPGLTGTVTGSCTQDCYIIAIPAGDDIENYTIPDINRGEDNEPATAYNCDLPKAPALYLGFFPEPALDYFLKYEKYKYDWNQKVASGTDDCDSIEKYSEQWDAYIEEISKFKIPSLATYSTDGTYTIENVPPGRYDLYTSTVNWGEAGNTSNYGELFYNTDFTELAGNPVTVSLGLTTIADFP